MVFKLLIRKFKQLKLFWVKFEFLFKFVNIILDYCI